MTFRVGQKVTPKNDDAWFVFGSDDFSVGDLPAFGKIYYVTDLIFKFKVQFLELYGVDGVFDARDFRPVVDPKIELPECLTALLDTSKHKPLYEPALKPQSVA